MFGRLFLRARAAGKFPSRDQYPPKKRSELPLHEVFFQARMFGRLFDGHAPQASFLLGINLKNAQI